MIAEQDKSTDEKPVVHISAIRAVCGQFVELCRRLKLFTRAVVAIDGSKFKAVNGYVLSRSASGAGVKTRLHDAQRQSWTISIFFLRIPLRVTWVLPQCGQRSGRLSVCATRVILVRVLGIGIGMPRA